MSKAEEKDRLGQKQTEGFHHSCKANVYIFSGFLSSWRQINPLSLVDNPFGCGGQQGRGSPEVHRDEVPDRVRVKGKRGCCCNTSQIRTKEQVVMQ